jgi:hypothetical protein
MTLVVSVIIKIVNGAFQCELPFMLTMKIIVRSTDFKAKGQDDQQRSHKGLHWVALQVDLFNAIRVFQSHI